MATAERFDKQVERTVVENAPMVRLELTLEEAKAVKAVLFRVKGPAHASYAKHAYHIQYVLQNAGVTFGDPNKYVVGILDAQPLPKEPD